MTKYLNAKQIITINAMLIKQHTPSEQIGVKDPAMLESAIHRPMQTAFEQDAYPSIYEKAAALLQSLNQNHPFYNANKRTAFIATLIFLKQNQIHFHPHPDDAEDFQVYLTTAKPAFDEIVTWIQENASPLHT
ncbi:type II toxin-antitoxin system death-on-curing family toxin [Bacillaceae bacterium SIJ1]|uniref:type II toxin-antitoxin system death-on-curing family toxin n=1 Tax=Litoribacterium kuwaitense TaxID=1398745 RepID=UPI0013EBB9E7|nr:type II toxin-antitoxin system death-on-curing family toxin [Litoribacterium kuwaitense]NGP44633.1 type II toxin-antitoxin system death-on-curing family toxin [Litoribacterium kuwaitense]